MIHTYLVPVLETLYNQVGMALVIDKMKKPVYILDVFVCAVCVGVCLGLQP